MVLLFRIVGYFVVQITQLEKFKEQAEKGEGKEVGLIYQTPALKQERFYSQSAGAYIRKKPSAVSDIEKTDLSF